MTVFLVDIYITGHHLTYIRLFSKLFQQLGYKVIILLPDHALNEIEAISFSEYDTPVDVSSFKNTEKPLVKGRISGRNALREKWEMIGNAIAINQHKVSGSFFVFFPYLDPFMGPYLLIKELDKIFPYNWSGLFMNPTNCRVPQSFSWLRKGIFSANHLLASKNCKTIFVYDDFSAKLLTSESGKQIITMPDIIDDSPPNQDFELVSIIKAKANEKKIISLLGSVSKRKGLITLLGAVELLKNDFFILIAGKLDVSTFSESERLFINETLDQYPDDIFFYNERISSESDFNALVQISNILFAAYINFTASSNLISKAAVFRKPIIVSRGYLMEELVKKYRLGLFVEAGNVNELVSAVITAGSAEYVDQYNRTARCYEYSLQLSDKYLSSLLKALL